MNTKHATWTAAQGSCGFHIGQKVVQAAYVNGVALFAYESPLSTEKAPAFTCMITGHTAIHGLTLDEVKAAGENFAKRNIEKGSHPVSINRFNEVVDHAVRFPLKEEQDLLEAA